MEKHVITIPEGIEYLSQLNEADRDIIGLTLDGKQMDKFELPNGICNKVVTACGGTTLALTDEHPTIICSPRIRLIDNKHEQMPDFTFVVKGNVDESDIRKYLSSATIPKLLSTFDSLPKVLRCIEPLENWRVVVDEFHFLLADSGMKSETEVRTLELLKRFPYVTYLSATPILDEYLEQIEVFKDIDYYELHWKSKRSIRINPIKVARPDAAVLRIVRRWQRGEPFGFTWKFDTPETYTSDECVIFYNSVRNILKIIKTAELKAEDVNLIISDNVENRRAVAKLGEGFEIGRIPLEGEPHKKITFCTSTVYAGCDFYSTCASTFVVADSAVKCTSVDIGIELWQIAGRQRLASNVFRDTITFIYRESWMDMDEEAFADMVEGKVLLTDALVSEYNATSGIVRKKHIEDTFKINKMTGYGSDYLTYDNSTDKFYCNDMARLYEQYAYNVHREYRKGIVVRCLNDAEFDVGKEQEWKQWYEERVKAFIVKETFEQKMKKYCDYRSGESMKLCLAVEEMLHDRPEIRYYYDELGEERIRALGYKESMLKSEVTFKVSLGRVTEDLKQKFPVGSRTATSEMKTIIRDVYGKHNIKKTGVASDLWKVYGFKVKACKISGDNGKRKNGYEIVAEP